MKVKIDTKEKFDVITIEDRFFSANMTDELNQMLLLYLKKPIKNVVLKLKNVEEADKQFAETLLALQQIFFYNKASFVICELQKSFENHLANMELTDALNIVPTESEAWDIVQMEEIEREFSE